MSRVSACSCAGMASPLAVSASTRQSLVLEELPKVIVRAALSSSDEGYPLKAGQSGVGHVR